MPIPKRSVSLAAVLGLALLSCAAVYAQDDGTAATTGPIVVLITIDGFPARALKNPRLPAPIPSPASTDQAPDLYLAAKPDYAFLEGTDGPMVQDITPARGTHGYLNTDPDMEALFIASGAHIRPGVDLGSISNLRVAPAIAKILGISLPAARQAPLTEALQ